MADTMKFGLERIVFGDPNVKPKYITWELDPNGDPNEKPRIEFNELRKFRYHMGGLDESMGTLIFVKSKAQLKHIVLDDMGFLKKDAYGIKVEPYAYDERIGWDTHLVTLILPGGIPKIVGFTDGPLED